MTIKVKYFADVFPIEVNTKGDWIDLRAAETVEMKKGEFKIVPLGIGMILPSGYEAYIVPRSSTFKNYGVTQTNSPGIVDNSYSGDDDQWMIPLLAHRDTVIHKNDRICQFRIQKKMPKISFKSVFNLNIINRDGFGSTGVK